MTVYVLLEPVLLTTKDCEFEDGTPCGVLEK